MINQKLNELYKAKINGVQRLSEIGLDIDGPLLMNCWDDEYLKSSYKILFIGKECNGWIGDLSDNVDSCLEHYINFKLSKNGNRTVFWQYVYLVNSLLNPEQKEGNNFLWTNVSKFCTLDGEGLEWNVHKETVNYFNCLSEEINIAKPDIVLFFSGPYYDDKIKIQFEGKVSFNQVFDEVPKNELAKVEHPNLPINSYRIYHPGALQRLGKSRYINRLVDLIRNTSLNSTT